MDFTDLLSELKNPTMTSNNMKVLKDPGRARREQDYINALRLKLDGMTKPVSALEKTMSRTQLYSAGSPLSCTSRSTNNNRTNHVTISTICIEQPTLDT